MGPRMLRFGGGSLGSTFWGKGQFQPSLKHPALAMVTVHDQGVKLGETLCTEKVPI